MRNEQADIALIETGMVAVRVTLVTDEDTPELSLRWLSRNEIEKPLHGEQESNDG